MAVSWQEYTGKKIFVLLKNSKHPYTGKVIDVDDQGNGLCFITIMDKYDKKVVFVTSEIISIKEEQY